MLYIKNTTTDRNIQQLVHYLILHWMSYRISCKNLVGCFINENKMICKFMNVKQLKDF